MRKTKTERRCDTIAKAMELIIHGETEVNIKGRRRRVLPVGTRIRRVCEQYKLDENFIRKLGHWEFRNV